MASPTSLDKKSLVELRGIAQSLGLVPRLDRGREDLLQDIAQYAGDKVKEPEKPVIINVVNAPDGGLSRDNVAEALKDFAQFGLRVTFPDERTWMLYCNGRYDSGHMSIPLWNIVQCAKEIIKK